MVSWKEEEVFNFPGKWKKFVNFLESGRSVELSWKVEEVLYFPGKWKTLYFPGN